MKNFEMDGVLSLLVLSLIHLTGAMQLMPESHWIPRGIQSVNGSSNNITACGSASCVLDGNIPNINTNDPNWASQLETVRKNDANDDIDFDHVVLTFSFSQNITLRLVELYVLYCPEWKIGAPYIALYGDHGLDFQHYIISTTSDFLDRYRVSECKSSSCDSLSLFNLIVQNGEPTYSTYHIVISDVRRTINWVHVGEVRFFDEPANKITELCPEEPSPGLISSVMQGSPSSSPSTQTTLTPSKLTKQSFTLFNSAYISLPSTQATLTPSKSTKQSSTLLNSPSNFQWSATSSPHTVLNDGIKPTKKNEISFLLIVLIAAIIIALLILIIYVAIVISFCLCRNTKPCSYGLNKVNSKTKSKILL